MAVDKKNRIKRAVLTWLCVAALTSGSLPGSFSGIIPAVTAAAEDPVTYDAVIDLSEIVYYRDGTIACPDGITIIPYDNGYGLKITTSGTYKLTGSNYINNSYVDVQIYTKWGVNATIICDDAYIKNDYGSCFPASGASGNSHGDITPFYVNSGSITLLGKLTVETYYCAADDFYSRVALGNVTGTFFDVVYKDAEGNSLGKTSYLSGSTYSDKSGITEGKCACYTINAEGNHVPFDPTNITEAATVICAYHDLNENGVCNDCGENFLIDLSKLPDYADSSDPILDGKVSVEVSYSYGSPRYIIYINESGSYILKGSNYINSCYCDVEFYSRYNADVTLVCDDVYIRNDDGVHEFDVSGNRHYYTITPFVVNNGSMKLTGKLAVDTFCCSEGDKIEDFKENDVNADYFAVTYQDENGKTIGKSYYLTGSTYSDKNDVLAGYKCREVNGTYFDAASVSGAAVVTLHADHSLDANSKCQNCGAQFRKVTVDDGINTPSTYRVADTDTFDSPADPTAPLGKKFAGWYVGDTEYNFSTPVTSDITITAHYEDSLIKSVATVTPPTNSINYIEGNKFDPTGLKIEVTYDDGRSEEITYDPANTLFKFSPALETALTPADTKITVTYGEKAEDGSNTLDIPITVAAKQVTSVAIKSAPTKTSYIEGNSFDPTGLVITLTYDNGDTVDVAYNDAPNDFTFDKDVLALGDTTVQITYGGKSVKHEIIVAEKSVVSASIKTVPQKTTYKVGEDIDVTGGTLILTYDNNSTKEIPITAAMLTYDNTKAGKATVTVTYGAFKDTFEVEFEKVTVDPTDPPKPTEPTKPSKPTEPTEPTKPTTNEPQIKGNDGKMGWDAILGEIDDAKDGDTVTVDMNGTTKLPKDIVNDLMGKDIDLVLDMGNGIVWTINGLTITNPIDVDMGVTIGSGIPVKVINAVTGECSYITITLAHNGEFGFVPVLTIEMNEKDIGYYANLYYYNETENSTEFINSGLIGKDGKVNLAFTHASEYVIVIDDHDHGKAADGSSDSDTNPSTGVTMVFGAALVSSAAMIISRKRRK